MARKTSVRAAQPGFSWTRSSISLDRCQRLCRLVNLLAEQSHTREALSRKLGIDMRGFYRDLVIVRQSGVPIKVDEGRYVLGETLTTALDRLPFPDPLLSLGEARTLVQGSSPGARKLRDLIGRITALK